MTDLIKTIERRGLLEHAEEVERYNEKKDLQKLSRWLHWQSSRIILGMLFVSLAFNTYFTLLHLHPVSQASPYAKLERDREEPYVIVTPYSSENETLQDELWYNINVDSAVVALSDDWAADHGLRKAQRFPWDDSKGMYILHGFHNLHCLKIIYISMSEFRRGTSQTRSWHHVSHCLDALRRQIICDADDTPRATDRRVEVVSGLLQHRRCRNWEHLEQFARKHTACYKRPETPDEKDQSKLDRFSHCPPDSGYVVTANYVPTEPLLSGLPAESIQDQF